ncbi:MAG: hypothetical protein AAGG01_10050 [Planctomycetota bacterium]
MNKFSFSLAGALALTSATAVAQQPVRGVTPFYGEITTGGVIDASTGVIYAPGTYLGPSLGEPIYNNTAVPPQGSFFTNQFDLKVYDEGRIPSTSSPDVVGTQDSYNISSISLQYVTDATDPSLGGTGITIEIEIYESYATCDVPDTMTNPPLATITLPGLPGSTTGNAAGFIFDVDVSGLGICIQADGDGVYSDGTSDLFGWSFQVTDTADATSAGPFLRGDPDNQPSGDATAFQNPGAAAGSGLGTVDAFGRLNADGSTQCLFFGGYPANIFSSFGIVLRSPLTGGCPGGIGAQLCAGVANSTGTGAVLTSAGDASAAANALTLDVARLPMNSMGYFIVSQDSNVVMNPGGSEGNICIASFVIGRYAGDVLDSGMAGAVSFSPDLTSIPVASGGMPGSSAAMAGDVYNFQYWYRDTSMGGMATSNFSSALSVTFE